MPTLVDERFLELSFSRSSMDYNSNLIRALFLTPVMLEWVTALLIFRRRLAREIPWFTIYLILDSTSNVIGFGFYQHGDRWLFFVQSWALNLIVWTIAFMVIAETGRNLLARYPA